MIKQRGFSDTNYTLRLSFLALIYYCICFCLFYASCIFSFDFTYLRSSLLYRKFYFFFLQCFVVFSFCLILQHPFVKTNSYLVQNSVSFFLCNPLLIYRFMLTFVIFGAWGCGCAAAGSRCSSTGTLIATVYL